MALSLIESVGAVSDLPSDSITQTQVISFDHIQLEMNQELPPLKSAWNENSPHLFF